MKRWVPWLVGAAITAVAAATAVGANTALERFLALPEGAAAPTARGAGDQVAATRPEPRPRPRPTLSKRQYIDDILKRNIFDADAIGQTSTSTSEDGDVALTDLNVRLIGTIVAVPEQYSSALIAEQNQHVPKGYGIGDKLYDAEVIKIETDKVHIRRGNGDIEIIAFKEEEGSRRPTASTRPRTGDEGDEGIDQIGDNKFVVDRGLVDRYMTDLDAISRMGRAIPHRGADGEIDGYRLSGIRRNSLGQQLGIKNGDIVHGVNGHPLTSMQGAMAAYQSLQSESSFTFEVTRRGQKLTLEYDVQ